jgi:hypothetical protein
LDFPGESHITTCAQLNSINNDEKELAGDVGGGVRDRKINYGGRVAIGRHSYVPSLA